MGIATEDNIIVNRQTVSMVWTRGNSGKSNKRVKQKINQIVQEEIHQIPETVSTRRTTQRKIYTWHDATVLVQDSKQWHAFAQKKRSEPLHTIDGRKEIFIMYVYEVLDYYNGELKFSKQ